MSRRPATVRLAAALDAGRRPSAAPPSAFPGAPEPLATRHAEPWPLTEADLDLPRDPPPVPIWVDAPLYLGHLTVTERGVVGPVSLDVLLTLDGCHMELGPLHFDRDALRRLLRLCQVLQALLGHDRPPPRPAAGLLSEGEPRP